MISDKFKGMLSTSVTQKPCLLHVPTIYRYNSIIFCFWKVWDCWFIYSIILIPPCHALLNKNCQPLVQVNLNMTSFALLFYFPPVWESNQIVLEHILGFKFTPFDIRTRFRILWDYLFFTKLILSHCGVKKSDVSKKKLPQNLWQ